jgi:hypothetical protein
LDRKAEILWTTSRVLTSACSLLRQVFKRCLKLAVQRLQGGDHNFIYDASLPVILDSKRPRTGLRHIAYLGVQVPWFHTLLTIRHAELIDELTFRHYFVPLI